MCGRYTLTRDEREFAKRLGLGVDRGSWFTPRYNIAPTQEAPIFVLTDRPELKVFRWGLIPHWARERPSSNPLINARAESVESKPAFRTAFHHHRCLVAADGFYEWAKERGVKQPCRIVLKSREPFMFAGVWDLWRNEAGQEIGSFAIITTEANECVARIHNRMPVILKPTSWDEWLDAKTDPAALKRLLVPYPGQEMEFYNVNPIVNNPRRDTADCISPWQGSEPPEQSELLLDLSQ
jgi:putative SOS response-associated peptidase YedK